LPRAAVTPPPTGDPLFLNPRLEDPMEFLMLDIRGQTFLFVPRPELTGEARERAIFTQTLVGLNKRAGLMENRKNSYVFRRSALESYDLAKSSGASKEKLAEIRSTLQHADHRTVWREMQRQHRHLTELALLFTRNPEALDW
jgi:hypothetical protein